MRIKSCPAVALVLLLASPALATTAHAADCVQFEILGRGVDRVYNPFQRGDYVDTFTVSAKKLDERVTSVRFLIVDSTPSGNNPKFGTDGPAQYDIDWVQDSGRRIFTIGAQTITDFNSARVSFGRNQSTDTTNFRLSVPGGQTAIAGRQVERLTVRYQCMAGRDEIGAPNDQFNGLMELSLNIPRIVSAYIGGVGQSHGEINFGRLNGSSALRKSISVTAMSTLPYAIDVSTDNGRKLMRGKNRDGAIDYNIYVAGVQVTSDAATIKCPVTPMPAGETRMLDVALDPSAISSQPAGDYQDTITLTFRPSEGYAGNACQQIERRR